jgi:hypothetical protein
MARRRLRVGGKRGRTVVVDNKRREVISLNLLNRIKLADSELFISTQWRWLPLSARPIHSSGGGRTAAALLASLAVV